MALEVNMYSNEVPLTVKLISDNASGILNAIKEEYFALRQNQSSQEIGKVIARTKPGAMDFLNKSKRVDLMTLSEDELKALSVEPNIDVILKEKQIQSFPAQGGRSRKSRRRKTRKNKRV